MEDFVSFLNLHQAPAIPKNAVIGWARQQALFPGKRGTGEYTADQLAVLGFVQGIGPNANSYACCKSRNTVGRGQQRQQGHAGEPVKAGLVGMHEYAILETHQQQALHYVKLVNPWQEKGRSYTQAIGRLQAQEQQAGVFSVELNDFVKRFSRITVTQ